MEPMVPSISAAGWRYFRGHSHPGGMQHCHGEGNIGIPIVYAVKRNGQFAARPLPYGIVIDRNQQAHENVQREQHHGHQADCAGDINRRNAFKHTYGRDPASCSGGNRREAYR